MESRIEIVYQKNIEILDSLIGLSLKSAVEEQFYHNGELNAESRGNLNLHFSNDKNYVFCCDSDANSLNINKGIFAKRQLELNDARYKWTSVKLFNDDKFLKLGKIIQVELELSYWYEREAQTGCKLTFESGDYFIIWTQESDKIFYDFNQLPRNSDFNSETYKMKSITQLKN